MPQIIVPDRFVVPPPLVTATFRFEPLSVRHNDLDHPAWTSSIAHIRDTPGFSDRDWPVRPLTLEENRGDLERHEADFASRKGFTYAVFDSRDETYAGCVYFYPPRTEEYDVDVRSWVRADRAELDQPLYDAVRHWLAACWPWRAPDYAERS